jgi:C-methyltransferase C-terminal domain/Methyltransferase domain
VIMTTVKEQKLYETRGTCRVCGWDLYVVLDLGVQSLPAWMPTVDEALAVVASPLVMALCLNRECSLVQLVHTTNPDLLFREYFYASGTNDSMRKALRDIVIKTAEKSHFESAKDTWVDIGCNDGTLFESLPSAAHLIGVDPSDVAARASIDVGHYELINNFFSAEAYGDRPLAHVVTAAAMLYDLENPIKFLEDVKEIMAGDGTFVAQVAYLPLMLMSNGFVDVCHEHLEYYSLRSLDYLFEQAGLKIFDAEINEVNGGSLRVYACKSEADRPGTPMLHALGIWEDHLYLNTEVPYQRFALRVEVVRDTLRRIIRHMRATRGDVWAYAASTKGNTLLQYCGFGPADITAIADRNPRKWGTFSSGTGIPVVSEEEFHKTNPEFALVLAYAFLEEFRDRERDWLDRGAST